MLKKQKAMYMLKKTETMYMLKKTERGDNHKIFFTNFPEIVIFSTSLSSYSSSFS